ncbi:hypothetical protein HPP92_022752 [Vanilla planifolia]|uniref:DNA-directed RNA polymerase II subunit RPB1 n=1 Tax=Vanilla planifolia TaxID=51239 RepID=A0A835PP47_VANPL|nr:hypothetical protein HPP92_022752 [Vanilla planifolia]
MSVAQIEHAETMDRGKVKHGGLNDARLRTIDRKAKCETCMGSMAECPGHFGLLELAKPMYHIGFLKTVGTVMRCVCFNCSKVFADQNSILDSYELQLGMYTWIVLAVLCSLMEMDGKGLFN